MGDGDPAGGDDGQQIAELYRLMVEMADRVSARRGTANGFFLALHTGLAAVIAALPVPGGSFRPWLLGLTGLLLTSSWWTLLKRYQKLNAAKFDVIHDLERRLPVTPYADEWAILATRPAKGERAWHEWRPTWRGLSAAERLVPIAFGALYAVILLMEAL